MRIFFDKVWLLNTKVREELCIFTHIACEFDCSWWIVGGHWLFWDNFVRNKEATLRQKEVKEVENGVLK